MYSINNTAYVRDILNFWGSFKAGCYLNQQNIKQKEANIHKFVSTGFQL